MVRMSLFPEFQNTLTPTELDVLLSDLDLTYGVLAERLNVDPKTIGRWANGETPIPGAVAILLQVATATARLAHHWPGPEVAAPRSRRVR